MSFIDGVTFGQGLGASTGIDGSASNFKGFICTETGSAMVDGQIVMLDTAQVGNDIGKCIKQATVTATSGNVFAVGVLTQPTATTDGTNLAKVDVITGKGSLASAVCDASVTGAGMPLGVDTTAGTFTALAATYAALAAGEAGRVTATSLAASAVGTDGVRRATVMLEVGI